MNTAARSQAIVDPERDGLPMSDNTLQFAWISKLVGSFRAIYRHDRHAFVVGDLRWYPIEGDNKTHSASDATGFCFR